MSVRQKRVQKILEIRERRLDQTASQLIRARELAEQAERALAEQKRRTEEALRERMELASREVTAGDWIDSEAWRMRMGNQELVLGERAARAQGVVQKASDLVRVARSDVKKIETLQQNLQQTETAAAERKDRVNQDEFAARRARVKAKDSER
jgi:flagellar biosynthesis chaperone FliJ